MRDKLGRSIEAGDWVAFATRDSCCAIMRVGKVREVEEGRVLVDAVDWILWDTKVLVKQKATWLRLEDRIVKIWTHQVPAEWREAFNPEADIELSW